jgi:hypothetical protein
MKFAQLFASQGAPLVANLQLVSTTPAANFATGTAGVSNKFAAVVNDNGGKLPPVSTTQVANLPPESTTLVTGGK